MLNAQRLENRHLIRQLGPESDKIGGLPSAFCVQRSALKCGKTTLTKPADYCLNGPFCGKTA
jgi:hypothetical protein